MGVRVVKRYSGYLAKALFFMNLRWVVNRAGAGYETAFPRACSRFVQPRGYNTVMPAAGPKRQPESTPRKHHPVPEIYTLETTGLLVIAILILVLTLVRYWHHIPWNAR